MNVKDYEKFSQLMADVHGFYQREVSQFALSVWWEAMRPFDFDAVAQALNRHVMNPDAGQYMPKPADAVRMLQGSTQDSALSAWAKVDKAVRHIGTYASVAFDDPLIHRVLYEMGGWTALGMKNESDWPFVAKEFENRYRAYKARSEVPEYPPVMVGIAEANNAKQGFKIAEPVLIGNVESARKVIGSGTTSPMIGFFRGDGQAETIGVRLVNRIMQQEEAA